MLNRDPSRVLYVSGHALDSTLQPENGVAIKPWMGESEDTALLDLIPFLECKLPINFYVWYLCDLIECLCGMTSNFLI